jgi:hypothetical protein
MPHVNKVATILLSNAVNSESNESSQEHPEIYHKIIIMTNYCHVHNLLSPSNICLQYIIDMTTNIIESKKKRLYMAKICNNNMTGKLSV